MKTIAVGLTRRGTLLIRRQSLGRDKPFYFSDLTPEAQARVLEFYKIESERDMNWDVVPLITLELDEGSEG